MTMGGVIATTAGWRHPLWAKPGTTTVTMGILGNYLRARRREWHLSQKELAFLLGYKNESIVSRLERHERKLNFPTLRACELIFGAVSKEIFPALSKEADENLLQRLHQLRAILEREEPTARTSRKLQLLDAAIARVMEAPIEHRNV